MSDFTSRLIVALFVAALAAGFGGVPVSLIVAAGLALAGCTRVPAVRRWWLGRRTAR